MNRHRGRHSFSTSHPTSYYRNLGRTLSCYAGMLGGGGTRISMAKMSSYRESLFFLTVGKTRSSGVNLDCPANYSGLCRKVFLWCWTAASAAVVWAQRWHCRQGFASSLVLGCVPLHTVWHFSFPEVWTLWLEKDWVCVQFRWCRRLLNIFAAIISKKEVAYDTFCHWKMRILFFWNFVWSKFAKTQVFKKKIQSIRYHEV